METPRNVNAVDPGGELAERDPSTRVSSLSSDTSSLTPTRARLEQLADDMVLDANRFAVNWGESHQVPRLLRAYAKKLRHRVTGDRPADGSRVNPLVVPPGRQDAGERPAYDTQDIIDIAREWPLSESDAGDAFSGDVLIHKLLAALEGAQHRIRETVTAFEKLAHTAKELQDRAEAAEARLAAAKGLIEKWRERQRGLEKSCELAAQDDMPEASEAYAEGAVAWKMAADDLAIVLGEGQP